MITFLRRLLFHDFWLKLFSLVIAVLIWLTVSLAIQKEVSPVAALTSTTKESTFYNLPVVVMSSAADVRNVRVSPSEAAVTLRGDSKLLDQLLPKDIRVIVDLTDIETARDLRKRIEVSTKAGLTLVRVMPEEVLVIYPAKS